MFDKLNGFKESVKNLKELEKKMQGIDLSDPDSVIDKLNLNFEDLEKNFNKSYDNKPILKYTLDADIKEPEYAYPTDSGFDLRASEESEIPPFGRLLIPTGLRFNIPVGCEIQVRPKSGLALKRGLSVLNTPGTVDNGYTGEVKVIVINLSNETQKIEKGDKIAQAVVCPILSGEHIDLIKVKDINGKDRNENGFGSTGN